jgi:LmbE family N-acetylglucosaminyl deacetylase
MTLRRLEQAIAPTNDPARPRVRGVLVAAHPDDEVIGAGATLTWMQPVAIIHLTDGAPRNGSDARNAGFHTASDYAVTRRHELAAALALGGVRSERISLGLVDQEVSLDLPGAVARLYRHICELQPEVILTHCYEGGHPDHDAAAWVVAAVQRLLTAGEMTPTVGEFTSYHADEAGGWNTGFLRYGDSPVFTHVLSAEERDLKRAMIRCFRTQQRVLEPFPIDVEQFRVAPRYDFSRPPHVGQLYYERFDWGMTGDRWRALAAAAQDVLGEGPYESWH